MFIPAIPSWATVKMVLMAAACIACFWGGVSVTKWYYKAGEVRAYQDQVARFRDQADQDRVKLAERDKELARIDNEATRWRNKWKSAQRDPVVMQWADMPHPPAVGLLLGGTLDLPGERDSRP